MRRLKTSYKYRNVINGNYVSEQYAQANPNTTVKETTVRSIQASVALKSVCERIKLLSKGWLSNQENTANADLIKGFKMGIELTVSVLEKKNPDYSSIE